MAAGELPDELLGLVFAYTYPVTLLLAVPAVCQQWRRVAAEIPGVRLDLSSFAPRIERLLGYDSDDSSESSSDSDAGSDGGASRAPAAAPEGGAKRCGSGRVGGDGDGGAVRCGGRGGGVDHDGGGVTSGFAALGNKFPKAGALVLRGCRALPLAAVVALAERCPCLTSVDFDWCSDLTDAAVVVRHTAGATLRGVRVQHVGGYGVLLGEGTRGCQLQGCELADLGGGGYVPLAGVSASNNSRAPRPPARRKGSHPH